MGEFRVCGMHIIGYLRGTLAPSSHCSIYMIMNLDLMIDIDSK
jgi:hypothetical protein